MMKTWWMAAAALVLSAALPGCAPVPDDLQLPSSGTGTLSVETVPFAPLDAGAAQVDSLHFRVLAYGPDNAKQISDQAEASYNRIMQDTNLYSFQPSKLYEIVVYASPQEYWAKTKQPQWSGGATVGSAICSFMGPGLPQTVAHEMTHLIFHEYMGDKVVQNPDYRWINEGLAVFEENKAANAAGYPGDIFAQVRPLVRSQPMPLDQIVHLVPSSEKARTVSLWYAQSQGMISYMIRRGGTLGFSAFLTGLRDGASVDQAIAQGFPGTFADLNGFYQSWLQGPQ